MSQKSSGGGAPARRRPLVSVVIAPGVRDAVAIRSAVSEWIVPLLVRDFLAEHPVVGSKSEVKADHQTTGVHSEGGAEKTRMNSYAR
jgi:hypothetical protein